MQVAPFMGAWIETDDEKAEVVAEAESHPSWVRGLKLDHTLIGGRSVEVAPFMGAWIETIHTGASLAMPIVAPFMGAWIETSSAPNLWMRTRVAPFMGAWIETRITSSCTCMTICRTLHGCVD